MPGVPELRRTGSCSASAVPVQVDLGYQGQVHVRLIVLGVTPEMQHYGDAPCILPTNSATSTKSKLSRDLVMSGEALRLPKFNMEVLCMKRTFSLMFLFAMVCALTFSISAAAQAKNAFGFNSPNIAGFPTGVVELTGGGAYNLANNFVQSGGGFRCIRTVNQGPLTGCLEGQGIRWDTVSILSSLKFKCTAADLAQTATTSDNTVVLLADFYRQGDGNDESFTAVPLIVSATDLPGHPGKNVWIQGVGCGSAIVNFNTAH